MTDQQLKTAAYKYCELMGMDPEKRIQAPSQSYEGLSVDVFCTEQAWEAVARMLKEHRAASLAIEHALKAE